MGFTVLLGEKGKRNLTDVSALDKDTLYWLINPKFDDSENESLRITYPAVLGIEVHKTIEELAKLRPEIWGVGGTQIPREDIIVQVYRPAGINPFEHMLEEAA